MSQTTNPIRVGILLAVLAAAQFTHNLDFMIMMPMGAQLMRIFNINPQQFSLLVSVYGIGAGISGLIAALFMDKFDRKAVLIFSYAGFTLGTFACGLSDSFVLLFLSRGITGAFGGVLGAIVLSIIADAVPEERRGFAIGILMGSFSVATVAGVPAGIFLSSAFNWQMPFYFIAALSGLLLLLIVFAVPSMKEHIGSRQEKTGPFEIVRLISEDANMQMALLFSTLLVIGQFMVVPFIAPYMVSNVGFSETDLTWIYLLGGGLTIITSPIVGRLSDKYGKPKMFAIFGSLVLLPTFFTTNLPRVPLWQALVVTSFFFIFANARMVPATSMTTSVVLPRNRGAFLSIRTSVQQFAMGIASFTGGIILTENAAGELVNYNYVGYLAVIIGFFCVWTGQKLKVLEGA